MIKRNVELQLPALAEKVNDVTTNELVEELANGLSDDDEDDDDDIDENSFPW